MDHDDEFLEAGPGLTASMWRYRWAILALTLVAGGAAYYLSQQQPAVYTATAQVLINDPRDPGLLGSTDAARFADPERFFPQQAQKMKSPAVLETAAATLGEDVSPEQIAESIEASAEVEINTVRVTAERGSAEQAAAFANAVAGAYQEVSAADTQREAEQAVAAIEEQLISLRDQAETAEAAAAADPEDSIAASRARILTERIIAIESRVGDIAAQAAVAGSGVDGIREAVPPEQPSAPKPERDAAMAGALMFMLASAGAYWLAGRDNRIQSAAEPATVLGVPLLGEVPKYRVSDSASIAGRISIPPAAAEAFQFVLSSIDFALTDVASAAVLLTSASAGDGKTVSALQIALAARRDGRHVTLVDGDLRAQGLTTLLAGQGSAGLSNLISGKASRVQATKRYRIEDDVILPVVTAGEYMGDPATLVRSEGFSDALSQLREESPLLILDSPPLLAVVDASVAGNHVDGIVLVISPDTSQSDLRKLKQRLSFVDAPVLGYIYNRSEGGVAAYDYGYGRPADKSRWRGKRREPGRPVRALPNPAENGRGDGSRVVPVKRSPSARR